MLLDSLRNFKEEVQQNENVHKLVKNWNPNIILETMDTEQIYTLQVRDCLIDQILNEENEESNHIIRLEADEEILTTIFSGEMNPAEAVLNGELVVFGDAKDQIKLDAITLLIWGM